MTEQTNEQALDGIKIVDCASIYAGPIISRFLGDFGADVIKVEHPAGGALRAYGKDDYVWRYVERNAKSVPLDLHDEKAKDIFKELVADADILIESFRPETLERWDLGWETLSDSNPELIMVRITGFGQSGPYSDRPGFGTLAESMSGFVAYNGEPDGKPVLPPSIGLSDQIAAFQGAIATLMALYWREMNNGTGQYIDVSLIETMSHVMAPFIMDYTAGGVEHERYGSRSPNNAPRNVYETKDGGYVAMSSATESIARRVLEIVGGEELREDPRFDSPQKRVQNVEELDRIVQDWMQEHTREEIVEIFSESEAALAPVYDVPDLLEDPHYEARGLFKEIHDEKFGDIEMPAPIPKMSKTPGKIDHAGPKIGAHTVEVLTSELGMSREEIAGLVEKGITYAPELDELDVEMDD